MREPSSSSVVAEDNKEVKEKGDSKGVNHADKMELHDRNSRLPSEM
jgi:hypothetical protein